jgi:tetratricopeptide (TPR) repeat protein
MNIPIVRQEDAFNLVTILRLNLCNLKSWSKVCFAVHCNRSAVVCPSTCGLVCCGWGYCRVKMKVGEFMKLFQTILCGGLCLLCASMPRVAFADETASEQNRAPQSGQSVSPSQLPSQPLPKQLSKESGVINQKRTVDQWEVSRTEALAAAGKHQYPQAETALQRLVKQAGESKSANPKLVLALRDLASVYASEKKFGDARVAYQRVLKIDEQKYGLESPMLITPLNDVIKVTCVTGKCYDTLPELKRLLKIRRKAHGVYSREVPVTLLLLGEAYEKHGDFAQAVTYFTEAVATEKRISGVHSPMAAALTKNTERAKIELAKQQRKAHELDSKRSQASNQKAPAKIHDAKTQSAKVRPIKDSRFRDGLLVE